MAPSTRSTPLLPHGVGGGSGGCCAHKCLCLSLFLSIATLATGLYFGQLLFGLFGSVQNLPETAPKIKFDSVGVTHLARVSAIACCPASAVESYTCAECAADGSFQNATIVSANYSGGLQAVVLVDKTIHNETAISVGFRGTMEAANWDIDADAKQVPPAPYLAHSNSTAGVLVHKGFQAAYSALRPALRDTVAALCALDLPIHSTGHSLGGSLATLFALDMAINPICPKRTVAPAPATLDTFGPDVRAAAPATLATFGQPRTGNPAFAAAVDTALTRVKMTAWRVVHHADFAPAAIPRLLGGAHYMHISREVWFSENNRNYSVCDGTGEDPRCSASVEKLAIRVLDHQQYMGYIFSSPCGGPSEADAALRYLCYAAGFSFLCFVVFLVRCRRCRRLQAMPAGLLQGAYGINAGSHYA